MSQQLMTVEEALNATGVGKLQRNLFCIFGLVWAADAMQVLAIGFSVPSIAATFGKTVPQALQTGTMLFVGMLIGAFVFGRLADRIGRRPVLWSVVIMDAVFGIASAFVNDFEILLALRLLTGLGVGGTLPVDYTTMAEFLPADRRGRWLVMLEAFWAVGTVALAVVALAAVSYGNDAWRIIFFLSSAPALLGLVLRYYVPESPVYLNKSGRSDEARQVLDRIAKTNGSTAMIGQLKPETPQKKSLTELFSPELRRRTILLFAAWFAISVSYYGIFVYLPVRLASEGFGFMRGQIFLVVLAIVQLPGYALAAYGVEKWGRKPTLIGFLAFSALGSFLYSFGNAYGLVVGATLLMSFAMLGTWGCLYAFTPEVFPTPLRATGMGSSGTIARIAGLLAPSIIVPIMTTNFTLAITTIAAILFVSAICVWFIDVETRNKALT